MGLSEQPIDVPVPQFGPDELLVRHDACGLCFSDIKVIRLGEDHPRIYRDMKKNPVVLGHEVSMTVVGDGRVFVETPFSGGMHAFTTEGEWLGIVTPFFNNPPMNTVGADSNSYVAMRIEIVPNDAGELMVTAYIGRYEEGENPVIKYCRSILPFRDTGSFPKHLLELCCAIHRNQKRGQMLNLTPLLYCRFTGAGGRNRTDTDARSTGF